MFGYVAESPHHHHLQCLAEGVKKGDGAPRLQFPVVWFGWFVEGDCSCISEAAWVVTLLYACVEQLLELVCHILVEEPEDVVCDPIRSWCFVLCQFEDHFLQLC